MTRDQIRGFIDRLGVSSRIDDDGDIAVTLTADNDFGHNVTIWVMIGDERRLAFIGSADNYHPDGDLLFLANRSNSRRNFPTAVVRGDEVRFEYSYYISEEVSDQYIINCIKSVMTSIWSGYRDLEKDTIEQG